MKIKELIYEQYGETTLLDIISDKLYRDTVMALNSGIDITGIDQPKGRGRPRRWIDVSFENLAKQGNINLQDYDALSINRAKGKALDRVISYFARTGPEAQAKKTDTRQQNKLIKAQEARRKEEEEARRIKQQGQQYFSDPKNKISTGSARPTSKPTWQIE
jgi:hypothetical protein